MQKRIVIAALVMAAGAQAQSTASRVTSAAERDLLTRLVAVEDSRQPIANDDPRTRGLTSSNAFIRAFTVRGLGRLENPAVGGAIEPLLRDASSEVRATAADALAQSVARAPAAGASAEDRARIGQQVATVRDQLTAGLKSERDPSVRAALLESIGRLPQGSVEQVKATANAIAPSLAASTVVERRGAIRGIFFLARKREARAVGVIPTEVTDKLYAMLLEPESAGFTPTDRFNIAFALHGTLALDVGRSRVLMDDRNSYVRERAVVALGRQTDPLLIRSLVERGMTDPEPVVRYRAINVYSQRLRGSCAPLIAMTRDRDTTVALGAVDALSACRDDSTVARHLATLASSFADNERWHIPTHAFVSLSVVDSAAAKRMLPRFLNASNFFVRMYADTAARLMGDVASLYTLSRDIHPNVQASAIEGLSRLVGHAADSIYLRALGSDDNQLLMAASAALKGSSHPDVARRAKDTWRRIHYRGAETDRDGREAVLELVRSLGDGVGEVAPAVPLRMALPTFDDLAALERVVARIEMMDGAVITMRLHPFEAPTNAFRFARLARGGTLNGLTFHRVAPFFVVQGPGPNANEYSAPDKPFARDELALSNVRGSVGLSTRGRDTGDGQIYINTVDNVWLDHEYTVVATVISGLAAFDRMQEGARIRRVTITP